MTREEIRADIEAKHEKRTEAVMRTIGNAPDVLSARERLCQALSVLPGVSADPDTMPDIMLYVDLYVQRKEDLDKRV